VDALEEAISEVQLREWGDFFAIEPWGSEAAFLRAGVVAATVANAPHRKAGAPPATPADFVPSFGAGAESRDDGLDPKRIRAELFGAFGGRIKRAAKNGEV